MKRYLLLFFIFSFAVGSGQIQPCGVGNVSFESELQRRIAIAQLPSDRTITSITYVPISMQLFGFDDGTGYADHNEINHGLSQLNFYFRNSNIQFYFKGTSFNHYPNTLFNNSAQTVEEEDAFHNVFASSDAVNVYMSNYLDLNGQAVGGYSYTGVSGPGSQFYNRIWLMSSASGAVVHEMGHFFGLPHTFNNSTNELISERELVTRNFNEPLPRLSANCQDKGDYVCDTESDPYGLENAETSDCIYVGTVLDANNDAFQPGVTNIMSYFGCGPGVLTIGQNGRMQNTLALFLDPSNGFTLDAPETVQPAPTAITMTPSDPTYSGMQTISWQDNSTVETGYIIERSDNVSGPFLPVMGVAENVTSVSNFQLMPGPNYLRIKASNTKETYSDVAGPFTENILCGNSYGQTCELTTNPDSAAYRIESFSLMKNDIPILENVNSGCSFNGIGNFYNLVNAQANQGDVLGFNVKSKAGIDGAFMVQAQIFCDWNNDFDFEDIDENLFSSSSSEYYEVIGTISIPLAIADGDYRLRVMLTASNIDQTYPCGFHFGEVEDYRISLSSLGSPEFGKSPFIISPNPVSELLYLPLDKYESMTIYDYTGKRVTMLKAEGGPVDVSSLEAGMYIVEISNNNIKHVGKFIKL